MKNHYTKHEGAVLFAAIEKHVPQIANEVRMKHIEETLGGDFGGVLGSIFGNKKRGKS